jgi:hypothetical protein
MLNLWHAARHQPLVSSTEQAEERNALGRRPTVVVTDAARIAQRMKSILAVIEVARGLPTSEADPEVIEARLNELRAGLPTI